MPDTAQFVETLREIVSNESPSADIDAVNACANVLADRGTRIAGVPPERLRVSGAPDALLWQLAEPGDERKPVLLLGHVDTVWPTGTVATRPFTVRGGNARGPGVFDMKAGLTLGLCALRRVVTVAAERAEPAPPVTFLVTGDEEVGSAASYSLIEAHAREASAVLVLEGAGHQGSTKHARKGWSRYTFRLYGRAAHAGLEPENGCNALVGLALLVPRIVAIAGSCRDVTVTPTTARAGETTNTIPDYAEMTVDVRVPTLADQESVDLAMHNLAGTDVTGVRVQVDGGPNRPPLEPRASASLLPRVSECAVRLGVPPPESTAVGGVSDGNITAALGVPTLDGLGAVGGGAHAEHEWVDVERTVDRIALLSELIRDLTARPVVADG